MMNSLCSGKAGKGGGRFSVNSFADNIAAQIDPIRWAALYLNGSSRGDVTVAVPPATRHPARQLSGGRQRSAKQFLVLPRNILPYEAGCCACVCARASGGAARRSALTGCSSRPQQPRARPSHRPPKLRAGSFGADTDSRFPSLRVFPSRLKLNKIIFRVAREGVKPHYCLIRM